MSPVFCRASYIYRVSAICSRSILPVSRHDQQDRSYFLERDNCDLQTSFVLLLWLVPASDRNKRKLIGLWYVSRPGSSSWKILMTKQTGRKKKLQVIKTVKWFQNYCFAGTIYPQLDRGTSRIEQMRFKIRLSVTTSESHPPFILSQIPFFKFLFSFFYRLFLSPSIDPLNFSLCFRIH